MEYFRNVLQSFLQIDVPNDPNPSDAVRDVLSLIKEQEEIRFYVDGTHHFGHQAATVNLMKRLIDSTGFAGRIRLIYAEHSTVPPGSTADKLALLLSGLDPRQIDHAAITYGTCKQITFLPFEERQSLIDEARMGFTGGADDMSINLARELKVRYFVRLQPYLWDDDDSQKDDPYYESSRIETPTDKYFYMVDEHPAFRDLAFSFSESLASHVSEDVWIWYAEQQKFDDALKVRTKNARLIYDAFRQNKNLLFWPLYGLHQFRESIAEIAMNIVFVALEAQEHLGRPIVAFCLNKPADITHFQKLLLPFARDLAEKNHSLTYFKAALVEHCEQELRDGLIYSTEGLDDFVEKVAAHVRPWIERASTLTFITDYNPETRTYINISESLERLFNNASKNEVIVALIGPVPGGIYNYFYANCKIPGVFEGQTTASLVVSLGRPFLQIMRENSLVKGNYPSIIGQKTFSQHAARATNAALELTTQRFAPYIQSTKLTDPSEYFRRLAQTSSFIVDAQNPSSEISAYFKSMGKFYQQDIHDKFVLGLIALLTCPF